MNSLLDEGTRQKLFTNLDICFKKSNGLPSIIYPMGNKVSLLHFVTFFHVASLFSTGVDNEKVGVDNEKVLELTNRTVFHRGRQ